MSMTIQRILTNVTALVCLVMLVLIFTQKQPPDLTWLSVDSVQNFKTLFISIVLEAMPFVLLGVLVSALLQTFVSEQTVRRWAPKNPVLGVMFACVLGIIFPLCECGMIPVIRRLIRKGLPVYTAVVFILAGPIINPVVYASTFMAFRTRPEIAYSRMALAFVVAATVGLLVYRLVRTNPLRAAHAHTHENTHTAAAHSHAHEHDHSHDHSHEKPGRLHRISSVFGHASDEFFDMGKYLIFGALLTALIQTFMSRESLVSIGEGPLSSHLFMMGFAYVLSLCSTSDAFVASSFATTFSTGSLVTFLVFGPMIDLKGTLMMLSAFRVKFVLLIITLVTIVTLAGSLVLERIVF
ncbi:permease [Paenibacillus sp. YYML68]|uniref:permease n=1 Tax=Paenibacillus sp. YYML68 TaxID=2909250 RepID=UPI0024924EA3|nr:permease [Paenibacillus sp. YYML68]